jgi:prepilin-type N-terminal cleavage/methylation domain-containing protein
VNHKKTGFTVVELLTVVAIIAILVAVLVPSLTAVRSLAKETKQKSQLTTIALAIEAFKNDYGDYPPSYYWLGAPYPPPAAGFGYCGAQKLAEALLGWDLMGFHPGSAWRADGLDEDGGSTIYNPNTLDERKGPYLELATASAFWLGRTTGHDGLFANTGTLNADRFVLTDVFGRKTVVINKGIDPTTGRLTTESVKAGTPILYYKANTSSKILVNNVSMFGNNIYNIRDNGVLIALGTITEGRQHPLENSDIFYSSVGGIVDPKVIVDPTDPQKLWPYRPDSYILISAGADGLYGTSDDICNFGN